MIPNNERLIREYERANVGAKVVARLSSSSKGPSLRLKEGPGRRKGRTKKGNDCEGGTKWNLLELSCGE